MKSLTIMQPWASAIAFGFKTYETRSRKTNHRGPIAIHAGKTYNQEIMEWPEIAFGLPWTDHLKMPVSRMWGHPSELDFPLGAIVAVAELDDCLLMDDALINEQSSQELSLGHWEPGRYAYRLNNVKLLPNPISIGGKQGLWNWEPGENDLIGIDIPTDPIE